MLKNEQNIASHKSCIIFAKLNSKVKYRREFKIKLFQEHETINLYSILFQGEEDTEFEKFFNKFKSDPKYLKDLQRIIYWIEKISERGALERNFRTSESKMKDGVCAIPIEVCKLRLYCLRISDRILILGNGDVKNQKTYNDKASLNDSVAVLASLDFFIKRRQEQHKIEINDKTITGNLSFYI